MAKHDKPVLVVPCHEAELICVNCTHRWIGVFTKQMRLKDIRCPVCKRLGTVIETGQSKKAWKEDEWEQYSRTFH